MTSRSTPKPTPNQRQSFHSKPFSSSSLLLQPFIVVYLSLSFCFDVFRLAANNSFILRANNPVPSSLSHLLQSQLRKPNALYFFSPSLSLAIIAKDWVWLAWVWMLWNPEKKPPLVLSNSLQCHCIFTPFLLSLLLIDLLHDKAGIFSYIIVGLSMHGEGCIYEM